MTALEDRRPVAATTTISRHPNVIGEDLAQLLLEHPGIELASVRLIPSTEHQGVGIVGRVGPIAEPECPSCHQLAGRPPTDYCQQPAVHVDPIRQPPTLTHRHDRQPCPARHPSSALFCERIAGHDGNHWTYNQRPWSDTPVIVEQRPDDDPADEITCDGRNCGGYPHA